METTKIDAAAGWKEADRLRDMQTQNDEKQMRRRIENTKLTSEM